MFALNKGEPGTQDGSNLDRVCVDSGVRVFCWLPDVAAGDVPDHAGPTQSPRAGKWSLRSVPQADALPGLLALPFPVGRENCLGFRLFCFLVFSRQAESSGTSRSIREVAKILRDHPGCPFPLGAIKTCCQIHGKCISFGRINFCFLLCKRSPSVPF